MVKDCGVFIDNYLTCLKQNIEPKNPCSLELHLYNTCLINETLNTNKQNHIYSFFSFV